jgi:magnesium chelatase subunit I
MTPTFPFPAIVAQEDMKRALLIAAVDETIGGVLLFGDRGTGKSTAVRALARLLPTIQAVPGCPYSLPADSTVCDASLCPVHGRHVNGHDRKLPVPVVDLPLGVTEDRVVGALDIERALTRGEKSFEPGLLARANRGFLYIDEVNLLDDHIVDLLLDVAASGENVVEREGLSVRHPAHFVLIGSGNPEEGELRPQLLDRFGLAVDVATPTNVEDRVEVLKRREAFEQDRGRYARKWSGQEGKLRNRVVAAREHLRTVDVSDEALALAAGLCIALHSDGSRGELTLIKSARALAALDGAESVTRKHLRAVAPMALAHRLRRNPLDESSGKTRVLRALDELGA